jgi:hypothetical protein
MSKHAYPTPQHAAAAQAVVDFFATRHEADCVLLVNSCARGKATPDSCLDITVVVPLTLMHDERAALESAWLAQYSHEDVYAHLRAVGRFSQLDLELTDGLFHPTERDWTSGPDVFELEVGNTLAYSVPLWQRNKRLSQLNAQWLPYYAEALRATRLAVARKYCLNNLDHIPLYIERGLYFQAFRRLYDASREFLQALFITRRTYPIAYDKWIKEQIVDILKLPELYPQLTALFEIQHFESTEIEHKGAHLRELVEQYTSDTPR